MMLTLSFSSVRMLTLRPMIPDDLPAVLAIQQACYVAAMNESAATLLARLDAAPRHAWVASLGGKVGAYLVGYPSRLGSITELDTPFRVAEQPDCLYLHDLAVAPDFSGLGAGRCLVQHALAAARTEGLGAAALVSVQNSRDYWAKLGFASPAMLNAAQRACLATYPAPAYYMARPL